jgi:hypothetical protein
MTEAEAKDWLPGDGSLDAIRAEHAENLARWSDPSKMQPSPYALATAVALLAEIDRLTDLLDVAIWQICPLA